MLSWTKEHPIFLAMVLIAVVTSVGYLRQEKLVRDNRELALRINEGTKERLVLVERLAKLRDERQKELADERCRERNFSQYQTRALVRTFVQDSAPFIGGARAEVMLKRIPRADYGTTDCNGDGKITATDYGKTDGR